ncbi:MAG: hypothetical protein IJT61_00695 [Bacteroidales bacterium]|nr:hypothetical protein [Bacteroidales bacterium]
MEKLIKILNKFDTLRDYFLNNKIKWDEAAVAECFKPCAEEILCGGYFLVNGKYIIDLGCIELYYHEEDGELKDAIMYHTNDKGSYSHFFKGKELPYFKFGSFNLHDSGVDVTFEREDKKYRASFLIRSYRMIEATDNAKDRDVLNNPCNPQFDPYSRHIFDDFFANGISFCAANPTTIKWIPCDKGGNVKLCKRQNVAEYRKNTDGKYEKILVTKKDYDALTEEEKNNYSYGGKDKNNIWYYKKETRYWGFKRNNILEKKITTNFYA